MFGLSFGELLIIGVVALLVLGPQGLPSLARTVGKALRQFRNATGDLRQAMESEFYRMDDPPKVTPRRRPEGAIAREEPAVVPDSAQEEPGVPSAAASLVAANATAVPTEAPAASDDAPSGADRIPPAGGRP